MASGQTVFVWSSNGTKCGFLYNVQATSIHLPCPTKESTTELRSALKLCFISDDSSTWSTSVAYYPYFYLSCPSREGVDVLIQFLNTKLTDNSIGPYKLDVISKVDLSLPNHLAKVGCAETKGRCLVKLSFNTIDQLDRAKTLISNLKRLYEREKTLHVGESKDADSNVHYAPDNYLMRQYQQDANLDFKQDMELDSTLLQGEGKNTLHPAMAFIGDLYEHDVRYITRVCIDLGIRCGTWYQVDRLGQQVTFTSIDKQCQAPFNVFAWDIECYKAPLKFPDVETDEVILISIMYNGQGYLIVNRAVVAKDIHEFSYNPSDELSGAGSFKVFNEANEAALLQKFFDLILVLRPHIFVSYNGDNFDFPYVHRRCQIHGMPMEQRIGVFKSRDGIFFSAYALNMDCFKWVERDSYLPFGARTLKQVCKIKLKYNPVEIDPEEMVALARVDPQKLAVYSVSDAVATYYLYMKFIHNFILALCYIVPLPPNDVLRQGTGTLCENLLMAEAYASDILFPNKHSPKGVYYYTYPDSGKQHLIYENSYIGARVETLECGVFRDDLKEKFNLKSEAYQQLLNTLDETLLFWARKHMQSEARSVEECFDEFDNFDQVYSDIKGRLQRLCDEPNLCTYPKIYHLDVGAMYPNIIISQRLQPTAIVTEQFCQLCAYYPESKVCQKRMQWKQKLEISPAERSQVLPIIHELKYRSYGRAPVQYTGSGTPGILGDAANQSDETSEGSSDDCADDDAAAAYGFNDDDDDDDTNDGNAPGAFARNNRNTKTSRSWHQLLERERQQEIFKAVKLYSLKAHKRIKVTKEVDAESIVCQRENPFYVHTVLRFRDRRYVYKRLKKEGEIAYKELLKQPNPDTVKLVQAKDKILINDSLQLAHKCILNSFYGYVKRGGSRWYSMEMGAIVTHMGAAIIDSARRWIDAIGTPIELDTDGIWCMVPDIFPAVLELAKKQEYGSKIVELEYLTTVLNLICSQRYTNDQYMELEDCGSYRTTSRNEIEFELDGPWHAMFLPASDKSAELLKKRYVVYDHQNQIVELKGFEIKRRSELRMIQLFQQEIFPRFLQGKTKEEAYASAAKIAQVYRYMMDSKAIDLSDDDLFELLLSKRTVRRPVSKTPLLKCFGVTTARRLAEMFKNEGYLTDGNLSVSFLLAALPVDAPRTARALPLQIFKIDQQLAAQYLAKWLRIQLSTALNSCPRNFLDWKYYKEKLDTQVLKLICIPAILQGLDNPCKGVVLPNWLTKRGCKLPQLSITSYFSSAASAAVSNSATNVTTQTTCTPSTLPAVSQPYIIDVEAEPEIQGVVEEESTLKKIKSKWVARVNRYRRNQRKFQNRMDANLYAQLRTKVVNCRTKHQLDLDDLYTLSTETWHICDYAQDPNIEGLVECIVSIYGRPEFFRVPLELWRYIYVHSTNQHACITNDHVNVTMLDQGYILPRGIKQFHLFQLEMKETYFTAKIKNYVGTLFNQGVYESNVPIEFDFEARLGNVCNVVNKSGCAVNESLQFRSKSLIGTTLMQNMETRYMEDVSIVYVHLLHGVDIQSKRRNRLFGAIYSKDPKMPNRIFVASPPGLFKISHADFIEIRDELVAKYRQEWQNRRSIWHEGYVNPIGFPDSFGTEWLPELEATSHASIRHAIRKLNTIMESLRPERCHRKYIAIVTCTLDMVELGPWATGTEYPVFNIDVRPEHKNINASRYMRNCMDISLKLLRHDSQLVEERLALAKVGSLPFLKMLRMEKACAFKYLYDILYTRALRTNYAISWGCVEPRPDLGTFCNPSRMGNDIDALEQELTVVCPGIYRGYGAKIGFGHSLLYNAIVAEARADQTIQHRTGHNKTSLTNGDSDDTCYVAASNTGLLELEARTLASAPIHPLAFRLLGGMLENLMKLTSTIFQQVDYGTFQSIVNLSSYLKPWLCDPLSLLYEPALYSRVLLSGQKYLAALLHFLGHNYGLKAINVDGTSMVVDANVATISKGRTKVFEALETLGGANSKFKNMPLVVQEEYVAMVELERNVYIRFKRYTVAAKEHVTESLRAFEYYPLGVEKFARNIMRSLAVASLWRILGPFYDNFETDEEPSALLHQDDFELKRQVNQNVIHDWYHPGVYFTRIQEMIKSLDTFTKSLNIEHRQMKFPMLPGSLVYAKGSWRQEVVKLFLYLLRIDTAPDWKSQTHCVAYDEKAMILFAIAGVAEYRSKTFESPVQRLEICGFCCDKCQMAIQVDVVGDVETGEDALGEFQCNWRCRYCNEPVNPDIIEWELLQLLEGFYESYENQHLRCSSCRRVYKRFNTGVCKCGQELQQSISKHSISNQIYAMRQVSQLARFKLVLEALDSVRYRRQRYRHSKRQRDTTAE